MIDHIRKYDEDEVLIFSGKFADKFTERFFEALKDTYSETMRNTVADSVEKVMKGYDKYAEVPLPEDLQEAMADAGVNTAVSFLKLVLAFGTTEKLGLTS
jgi:hypothetical protein